MPTTGWRHSKFNQFIKNRYQQTWHTIEFSNNRHTRHHPNQTFRIAPEQLSKLTRPTSTWQIHVSATTNTRISPHPHNSTLKSEPFSRPFRRGFGRYFSASAAATQKTIHAPQPHRKSTFRGGRCRPKPRNHRVFGGISSPKRHPVSGYVLLWSGSHPAGTSQHPQRNFEVSLPGCEPVPIQDADVLSISDLRPER